MNRVLAATTTVIIACACWAAAAVPQTQPAGTARPAPQEFPNFGVTVSPPTGWREFPQDKVKTIVQWMSPDSGPAGLMAFVTVEGGRPAAGGGGPEAIAKGLAKDWGGSVDDEKTALDGEPAFRVRARPRGKGLSPVEGIVSARDGNLFMILGGVTPGRDCSQQIEQVRAGWKWTGVANPAKHLAFRPEPLPLGDAATVNVPRLMHTYPAAEPGRVLDLDHRG